MRELQLAVVVAALVVRGHRAADNEPPLEDVFLERTSNAVGNGIAVEEGELFPQTFGRQHFNLSNSNRKLFYRITVS